MGVEPADLQIAGRILGFANSQSSGTVDIAVVYNPAVPASVDAARATVAAFGTGLTVGDLVLRARLVEQGRLGQLTGYGAVFDMPGVDDGVLRPALQLRQVPCFSTRLDQVAHGSCTVAISSSPSVSIVVSQSNAELAHVRFATAFRMMVREI